MSARLVNIDRDIPMLFPPDLRNWLPADHLAYCTVDIVERLNRARFKVNNRGASSTRLK